MAQTPGPDRPNREPPREPEEVPEVMPTDEGARISGRQYFGMPAWYHGVLILVVAALIILVSFFFA